jgi:hypothetical protein
MIKPTIAAERTPAIKRPADARIARMASAPNDLTQSEVFALSRRLELAGK